jgi:hypothetical protein
LSVNAVNLENKRRLHHNVLAIALANKLARIAWSVLAHDRNFEPRTSRRMRTLVTLMAHLRPVR